MEKVNDILDIILNYFVSLDWVFIMTFILLASIVTRDGYVSMFPKFLRKTMLKVSKTWRVLALGILYGAFVFWVRNYQVNVHLENLINSMVFALVFHGSIIRYVFSYFDRKLTLPDLRNNQDE